MFFGLIGIEVFLVMVFWMSRIIGSSTDDFADEIIFGFFGKEDKEIYDTPIKSVIAETDTTAQVRTSLVEAPPAFVKAMYAPIRGDRLNELKKAEQGHRNRLARVNAIPGRLNLRLQRDHFMGPLGNYSLEALYICYLYLELPADMKAIPENKMKTLNDLFELIHKPHQSLQGLQISFSHPLCYDAMKYLGDSLQLHQIQWLIENVPNALFENFELMTILPDYSFLTETLLQTHAMKHKTFMAVDFLSIPTFVKTAPADLLLLLLSSNFEPSRHWDILLEHRGLADLLKDQKNAENPHYYPFLVGVGSFEYLTDASDITKKIRKNGLTILIMASLIAYVQETNALIQNLMIEIATIWADVHKNSHLGESPDVNKEFNERVNLPLNNLLYVKEQREDVNFLIKQLDEGLIPAHPSITSNCPDWLKYLKILVQTPFDALLRGSFASRCSKPFMAPIHSDDEQNIVKLPRLITPDNKELYGIHLTADPMYIFNPLIWNSLWRNIFYENGEEWRTDPEVQNLSDKQFEEYLKPKYEVLYRDSKNGINELIEAWMKLSVVLPESYSRGPRLLRFISAIAIPLPPEGFELPAEIKEEREKFIRNVFTAVNVGICLVDKPSVEFIKFALKDSKEIIKIMEELSQISPNGHNKEITSIKTLEMYCQQVNSVMNFRNDTISPLTVFELLRGIEAAFATLGGTLSEDQIKAIGESEEINRFLSRHGRSFLRSQIRGLLKSQMGQLLLKSNEPMANSLLDYSEFTLKNFEEIGIDIDGIKLNLATVPTSLQLLYLNKKGFSNIDDPIALVYSLGYNMWTDTTIFKNLALWELFNPVVLAYDLNQTAECSFIQHICGLKHKLHKKVLLDLALVFITKWLIAQDWYAFVYHVVIGKGAGMFGPMIIERLKKIYPKYLAEGEHEGRKYLVEWLQVAEEGRAIDGTNRKESVACALAGLIVAVDTAPLTPFREIINRSSSPVSGLLSKPFTSSSHSPSLLDYVQSLITNNFKANDKSVWMSRLEILSQFSVETGKLKNENDSSDFTRSRLRTLPKFDALIYKWALELEGVCVESLFRAANQKNLEIDPKSPGVVPKNMKTGETKTETKKETKKKNKNKNKK